MVGHMKLLASAKQKVLSLLLGLINVSVPLFLHDLFISGRLVMLMGILVTRRGDGTQHRQCLSDHRLLCAVCYCTAIDGVKFLTNNCTIVIVSYLLSLGRKYQYNFVEISNKSRKIPFNKT